MKYEILDNIRYKKVEKFDIKINGIQLVETNNEIEIYNDPFRTIPIFIAKAEGEKLIVFTDFEDYYLFEGVDKSIDEAGFWEVILFGSGLWTRTLYQNVHQMPSASKLVINKETNQFKIQKYWDFNIEEDKSIDSMEKAAQGLYERLDSIFSKLDKNQKYVMGMSGGMDSRITLAFLSKYIPKENLELFTYGFNDQLLEYKYACEVADALGYNKPVFHKLTKNSYIKAMDYLPKMSGGQIGINHCHIIDHLIGRRGDQHKQITTYFSDAILGWDSVVDKNIDDVNFNPYITLLNQYNFLSDEIKNTIKQDSLKVFSEIKDTSNYCSLNEYKYITERNQKFHMYLASIQERERGISHIYSDYELLSYIMTVPLKYRQQKKILDYLLDNYFKKVSSTEIKNISSRFQWGNKFSGVIPFYWFKLLNRINAVLRPLTKGSLQFFNKYQTEEQERLLYRDFHNDLKDATTKFVELGLINEQQKKDWDSLPLRNSGVSERFHMISVNQVID